MKRNRGVAMQLHQMSSIVIIFIANIVTGNLHQVFIKCFKCI